MYVCRHKILLSARKCSLFSAVTPFFWPKKQNVGGTVHSTPFWLISFLLSLQKYHTQTGNGDQREFCVVQQEINGRFDALILLLRGAVVWHHSHVVRV